MEHKKLLKFYFLPIKWLLTTWRICQTYAVKLATAEPIFLPGSHPRAFSLYINYTFFKWCIMYLFTVYWSRSHRIYFGRPFTRCSKTLCMLYKYFKCHNTVYSTSEVSWHIWFSIFYSHILVRYLKWRTLTLRDSLSR
jgi:hypothetical protein